MTNIELFDRYAAAIFGELYESFPIKTDIDARKISGHAETNEYGAICDSTGRRSKEAEIAYATIEWLADTGYVRAKDKLYPFGYSQCVLTAEGLRLLKAVPDSVQIKTTVGDKLVRLLKEGSIEMAKDVVRSLLGGG